MSIGMTYEQFWEESPFLVIAYRDAHELKMREMNQQMWVQGLYIKSAIISSLDKNVKYPKEPFDIRSKTTAEIKADKEIAIKQAIKQLEAIKSAYKRKGK